jgi:hypothetical protein
MTQHNERAAPAGRPPLKTVRLAAERHEYRPETRRSQHRSIAPDEAQRRAAEAGRAARRAHADALAVGSRHGATFDALANRFARQARAFALLGGGAA